MRKTGSFGRWLAAAAVAALIVVLPAAAADFSLRLISQTNSRITLGWDARQNVVNYTFYANGQRVSNTYDGSRTTVTFMKVNCTVTPCYKVQALVSDGVGGYPTTTPPPPTPQCSDTFDNDNDTLIDYPADPGCTSAADNDEFNAPPPQPACADGIDNDNPPDGKIDYPADPGCVSSSDNDETDPTPPPTGNVFLSPSGSDSNPCTQAAPCRSLQRGATVAQSGQTVSLASGTYPAQNLSNVQKAVTFQGPAKIQDLGVTCTTGVTLRDISATSLAILAGNDNLTVTGGRFGFGTYVRNVEDDPVVIGDVGSCSTGDLSNNVIVENATIGGYVYPGGDEGSAHPDCLQFYGGNDGVVIRNNAFDGCDDSYVGGFPDFGNIRNVLIENNTFTGLEESSSFYFSQWGQPGHPFRCEFITWRGNTIHANLGLRTECWDMLVENNVFDAPGPGSFQCSSWAQNWRAVWRNNTFLKGGACVT